MKGGSEKEIEEEWEKVVKRIGYERRGGSKRQRREWRGQEGHLRR